MTRRSALLLGLGIMALALVSMGATFLFFRVGDDGGAAETITIRETDGRTTVVHSMQDAIASVKASSGLRILVPSYLPRGFRPVEISFLGDPHGRTPSILVRFEAGGGAILYAELIGAFPENPAIPAADRVSSDQRAVRYGDGADLIYQWHRDADVISVGGQGTARLSESESVRILRSVPER